MLLQLLGFLAANAAFSAGRLPGVLPAETLFSAGRLPGVLPAETLNFSAGLLDVHSEVGHLSVFHAHVPHPKKAAPLIVWMNGGPGGSSLMGFFTELGPYLLNQRSLPPAVTDEWRPFSNPSAWSTLGSLLVWEQPAGVGFSRCKGGCPMPWNDTSSAIANLAILKAFYAAYPAETSRRLVITGESYAGVYVPLLAQRVLHDAALRASRVKLVGAAVGDGCIGFGVSGGCGLDALDVFVSVLERVSPVVSEDALGGVRASCSTAELTTGRLPKELSTGCAAAMRDLFIEVGEYNQYHFGSPCGPDGQGNWGAGDAFACANGVLQAYLALPETQEALNVIRPGEAPLNWTAWDGDSPFYHITAADVQPAYRELLGAGVPMLIYSGLRDTGVPKVGAEKWLPRVGGGPPTSRRRKWGAPPKGEFAGHVTEYAGGNLTFVTVAGAGHLVPADRPIASHTMLGAWLHGEQMPTYQGAPCKRLWLGRGYGDFCDATHGEM
jgi:hypothetical protein